ncbi:hypothetical protein [Williamsia sp. DF01-3]|uniref:hypothetical protein n=1 Tax=Williamsia sp. DF01-3 TaxID=2934157 RepID=UPI000DB8F168|nr:hypothetical protein [Williamsia sp. DF01-3]MCK0515765.1 hypothetical protein [Williamsia sp. DF01-3]PZU02009.1 MAG: hypothetical protein DI630_10035 [Gordonia sp. (in: high G+C Gram-positive bacteria)]
MHEEVRTSVLGGEVASRGVPVAQLVIGGAGVLAGVVAMVMIGGLFGLGVAAAVVIAALGSTLNLFNDESLAGIAAHRCSTWWRRRDGRHIWLTPGDPALGIAPDPDYGDPAVDPGWTFPPALGACEPIDLAGTGLDDLFILWHHNPGERSYFQIIMSVQGQAEGLRSNERWAQNQAAYSESVLNAAARDTVFTRSLQLVLRVVPADLDPHEQWLEREVAKLPPDRAAQLEPAIVSYGHLIDDARPLSEEPYSYLSIAIPENGRLMAEASRIARSKNATAEGGVAQVIRDEAARIQRALQSAGFGRVDVLGEQRACAVMRAMINPSFALDRHQGAGWRNWIPTFFGGHDSVLVRASTDPDRRDEYWHTRVGVIPPSKIPPVQLGPAWLTPLLSRVEPDPGDPGDGLPPSPTMRTIAVRMDLVPARIARAATKRHATNDAAKAIELQQKGQISDGSEEVLSSSSARRREDLKAGTGYHGVIWSMAVAVTGRDADDLDRACDRVTAAAGDSAIPEIRWCTDDHDIALFWTLPLGRGLARTKFTRN